MADRQIIGRWAQRAEGSPPAESWDAVPPLLHGGERSNARSQRGVWLAAAVLTILVFTGLHAFPPEGQAFYPVCGFHSWTGLHCPGCGSLRAMHHLAHGRLLAAADSNLLLVVGVAAVGLRILGRWLRGRPVWIRWAEVSPRCLGWMVACLIVFGVLRNLPVFPFSWLAP